MFFAVQSYDIPSGLDKPVNSYQKTIYVSDITQEKMRPTHGGRSYTFVAPALWNGLLADLRYVPPLSVFKNKLKTFLFRSSFKKSFPILMIMFLITIFFIL